MILRGPSSVASLLLPLLQPCRRGLAPFFVPAPASPDPLPRQILRRPALSPIGQCEVVHGGQRGGMVRSQDPRPLLQRLLMQGSRLRRPALSTIGFRKVVHGGQGGGIVAPRIHLLFCSARMQRCSLSIIFPSSRKNQPTRYAMFANSSVFKASGSINGPIRNRQITQPPSAENRKDMSAP